MWGLKSIIEISSLKSWHFLNFIVELEFVVPGEVAEWFKAQHWKCCDGATYPRVRISPSPFPLHSKNYSDFGAHLLPLSCAILIYKISVIFSWKYNTDINYHHCYNTLVRV
jgi:hypothetical protein